MHRPRSLIAEDDEIIAAHLEEVLAPRGHEIVDVVATGRDAVERAAPDLARMDIQQGDDMNGIVAAQHPFKRKGGTVEHDRRLQQCVAPDTGLAVVKSTCVRVALLSLVMLTGCHDDCGGWTQNSIDPRIRRIEGGIAIGTDSTIFSMLKPVARADGRLWGLAMHPGGDDFVVVGEAGTIRYSRDEGNTWAAPVSAAVADDLFAVQYSCDEDSPFLVGVGDGGRILRSTTAGKEWSPIPSPTSRPLRGVAMVHPDTVVAIGDGGTILRSTDGGITWEPVSSGTQQDMLSVSFERCSDQVGVAHDVRGLAVGRGGTVLATHDGGESWTSVQVGLTDDLLQVSNVYIHLQGSGKISGTLLDAHHLWALHEESNPRSLEREFDAPVFSVNGNSVIGEGVLYSLADPKLCAPD